MNDGNDPPGNDDGGHPICPHDDIITLYFEITFNKNLDLLSHDGETRHACRLTCLGGNNPRDPIIIAPLEVLRGRLTRGDQDYLQKWLDNRALLSIATGFADLERARETGHPRNHPETK